MGARRTADENLRRLSALMPLLDVPIHDDDPGRSRRDSRRDGVGELMEEKHWPKEDVFAVQFALQEAVANAIRHGCRGDRQQACAMFGQLRRIR